MVIAKKIIIILIPGVASNGFTEAVTNQQILEKLNSIDVRIARLEEGQKSLQKQINDLKEEMRGGQQSLQNQINGLQGQINGLQNMVLGVLAGIFALIGFVLWDRRTALAPAVREMEIVKKRDEKIIRILEEYALTEPKLAAIMRNIAL